MAAFEVQQYFLSIMQTYENEEKGLFTFYLQQANQDDILRGQKSLQKAKRKLQRQAKVIFNQTHLLDHQTNNNISESFKRKATHNQTTVTCLPQEFMPQIHQKKQNADKIVQLLERHKYTHHNKSQIKVILKHEDQIEKVTSSQLLKAHLLKLMNKSSQQISPLGKDDSKLTDKIKQNKGKNISNPKPNPFRKLALQPTNFDHQISSVFQQKKGNMPHNSKSLILRKQKKHQYFKHRYEQIVKMQDQDHFQPKYIFPQIKFKSNSQIMRKLNKQIHNNNGLVQGLSARYKNPIKINQTYLKPIQTDRNQQKRQYLLNVESLKINNQQFYNNNRYQDKYSSSVLTQNQDEKSQSKIEFNKDIAFKDIVKALKFK